MATAKKAKKRNYKKVVVKTQTASIPSVNSPEFETRFQEHMVEVDSFARKIITIIEQENIPGVVATDALQLLLIASVKSLMGATAGELLKEHLEDFQKKAAIVSVLESILGTAAKAKKAQDDRPLEERSMLDILGPLSEKE